MSNMCYFHPLLLCTYTILPFLCVRFVGGYVGPDEGFRDVWDILAGDVHDRGLGMSIQHLVGVKDHFDV